MSDVKISVGGEIGKEASRRFVKAWQRAKRGERVRERHLSFESWEAMTRVLTGKRLKLLQHVRHHNVASVRALAKALERDYSNIHADVPALVAAGLLQVEKGGMRTHYDAIRVRSEH